MGMSFNRMTDAVRRTTLVFLVLLTGCGATTHDPSTPQVVATTTQPPAFPPNAAPHADVTAILKPNTDPHEYEVRPRDVKALARAAIVLRSGGEVDAWLGDALDAAGVDEDEVVDVGAAVDPVPGDPHWWQDPVRAVAAA